MKLKDFNQLQKMMKLTTSANDGEALNAIRMANKLLERNSVDWDRVFKRLVTVDVEEVEPHPQEQREKRERDKTVDEAFAYVIPRLPEASRFRNFILDLQHQWEEKGWLSPAQREALFTAKRNAANRE